MQTFVNEMLSFQEIDKIKSNDDKNYDPNLEISKQMKSFNFHRMKSTVTKNDKIMCRRLERIGSFMMPQEGIDRQIILTAFDVISQSMVVSSDSEESDDSN